MLDSDQLGLLLNKDFLLYKKEEIDQLLHSKDWSKTSLGNYTSWSQSFHTALNIVFNTNLPMALCWGRSAPRP